MSADLHKHVKKLNYTRIVQMCVECLHCSDIGYRHTYTHSAWNAYVTYMTLYLYSYSYYLHILTHICMYIFLYSLQAARTATIVIFTATVPETHINSQTSILSPLSKGQTLHKQTTSFLPSSPPALS